MSSDDYPFLETVEEDGEVKTAGDIVLATGANWTKLGLTMITSLLVGWYLGILSFIQGVTQFFVSRYPPDITIVETRRTDPEGGVLDAGASFVAELLTSIIEGPLGWLETAATETTGFVETTFTGELAILAFPAGVAALMAGLWVAAKGVEVLR